MGPKWLRHGICVSERPPVRSVTRLWHRKGLLFYPIVNSMELIWINHRSYKGPTQSLHPHESAENRPQRQGQLLVCLFISFIQPRFDAHFTVLKIRETRASPNTVRNSRASWRFKALPIMPRLQMCLLPPGRSFSNLMVRKQTLEPVLKSRSHVCSPRILSSRTPDSIQQDTGIARKIRNFWFFRDGSVTLKYHGTNRSSIIDVYEALASIQ